MALEWQSVASLPEARNSSAAVTADGLSRVYVIGGLRPNGDRAATAYRYSPDTGSWGTVPYPYGRPVSRAGAGTDAQGRVYVFGGTLDGSQFELSAPTDRAYRLDPATGSWVQVASLPAAATFAPTAPRDSQGRLYAVQVNGTVRRYDPTTDAWTTVSTSGPSGVRTAAMDSAGRLIVTASSTATDAIWRMSPAGSWTEWRYLAQTGAKSVVADPRGEYVYLLGGLSTTNNPLLRLPSGASSWDRTEYPQPVPGLGSVLAVTSNRGPYLLGGQEGGTALAHPGQPTATGVLFAPVNTPPLAPTPTTPVDGAVLDRTQANTFRWRFNDLDPGDTQSAYRMRYRMAGAAAWTGDTGWVTSTSEWHMLPSGALAEGDYEWQVAAKDALGVQGPSSSSAYFTAGTPLPGPSLTAPSNGAMIATASVVVEWSTPDQDAYQLQVLDLENTVLWDSGQVDTATARSRSVDLPTNEVGRRLSLRVLHEGLWSEWTTVQVEVSYTQPATPDVTVDDMTTAGAIRVQAAHPAPQGDQPPVEYVDVYRREATDGGPGIRRATMLPPSAVFADWFVASGVDYAYRVLAVAVNGTSSWSEWSLEPAPIWEDLDGGTPTTGGGTFFDGGTP